MPPRAHQHDLATHEQVRPAGQMMFVAPAEKALLLLIRERGHGQLTLVFRGGLPTHATQIEQCIHLGQWTGENI